MTTQWKQLSPTIAFIRLHGAPTLNAHKNSILRAKRQPGGDSENRSVPEEWERNRGSAEDSVEFAPTGNHVTASYVGSRR